ncbi:MAG: twin-arginine translocase TatA/TatE family subunit [Devosia sp.]|nr:twin-arginine translocase TatA/TatE family subunit [Devosia sp.]
MHAPGIWGIIIVAAVVLLLFGRGKISGMMGEVASGIKAFQKGMKDEDKPTPLEAGTTIDAREIDRSKDV